eukprot:TRINITY_DN8011_c0_g1_i1.p1 TRINITY_DN8011_c0_g1~~TRINITY_DN8011_c0_g1_i1.p1  ORF type:complete len:255 (+),score=70.59 TRINITY_DN8011_c0_g1_i1:74-838(+)
MNTSSFLVVMALALLAVVVSSVRSDGLYAGSMNDVAYGSCMNWEQDAELRSDDRLQAQVGIKQIAVPFMTFWNFFSQPQYWYMWNPLFINETTTDFPLCGALNSGYSNGEYLVKFCEFPDNVQPHFIVQNELSPYNSSAAYAWQFNITETSNNTNIIQGRHTFYMEDLGNGTTSVQTWEKAVGLQLDLTPNCVLAWNLALQESLLDAINGVTCLERVYFETGGLAPSDVATTCQAFVPEMTKRSMVATLSKLSL